MASIQDYETDALPSLSSNQQLPQVLAHEHMSLALGIFQEELLIVIG